jgi:hypothetical protein
VLPEAEQPLHFCWAVPNFLSPPALPGWPGIFGIAFDFNGLCTVGVTGTVSAEW